MSILNCFPDCIKVSECAVPVVNLRNVASGYNRTHALIVVGATVLTAIQLVGFAYARSKLTDPEARDVCAYTAAGLSFVNLVATGIFLRCSYNR